jgi:hypothetical protein
MNTDIKKAYEIKLTGVQAHLLAAAIRKLDLLDAATHGPLISIRAADLQEELDMLPGMLEELEEGCMNDLCEDICNNGEPVTYAPRDDEARAMQALEEEGDLDDDRDSDDDREDYARAYQG